MERCRPVAIAAALMIAAAVSFVPMALLNIHFTGDYTGDPTNSGQMKLTNPFIGVLGNGLQMLNDNLAPPIQPRGVDWKHLLPSALAVPLARDFPRLTLRSGELQIEEDAGVGLAIILFTGLFLFEGIRARLIASSLVIARDKQATWVVAAGAIALLAYMAKMGSEATSRLIAAYYPLVLAGILVLVSLDGRIMHRRILRWVGFAAMLSALPLIILSPARPLFPVQAVANLMIKSHVSPEIISRYNNVYGVYAARADIFRELIAPVPPTERALGLIQMGDDTQAPLWRPFGSRKVLEIMPDDSPEQLKARGIHFVVVCQDALTLHYHTTIALLCAKWSASLLAQKDIVMKAHKGPETWYVLQL